MAALASEVPLKVGVVTLVIRSLLELPLSEAELRLGVEGAAGAVVSITTVEMLEAALTLPAVSLALTLRLWLPSASTELVIVQLPPPLAVVVPSSVVPLVS
jgi:hypothetical protein